MPRALCGSGLWAWALGHRGLEQEASNELYDSGRKQKVAKTFVCADLKRFLPPWAKSGKLATSQKESSQQSDAAAELAKALGLPQRAKEPPLTTEQHAAAWIRYGYTAVAAGPIFLILVPARGPPLFPCVVMSMLPIRTFYNCAACFAP